MERNNRIDPLKIPSLDVEYYSSTFVSKNNIGGPEVKLDFGMINHSNTDIRVLTRNGLSYLFPGKPGHYYQGLIFKEGIEAMQDIEVHRNANFQEVDGNNVSPAESLFINYRNANNGVFNRNHVYRGQVRSANSHCRVTIDSIRSAGGTVYLPYMDVVVTTHVTDPNIFHPFSREGTRNRLLSMNSDGKKFQLTIYIVDNKGRYGDRYINFCGHVHKVPVIFQPGTAEGVWITAPVPLEARSATMEYETTHYSIEEAEDLFGLRKTIEEAETYGFSKEAMERINLKNKKDLGDVEHERKIEESKRKQEEERRKQEDERLKIERARLNDDRAKLEYERKRNEFNDQEHRRKLDSTIGFMSRYGEIILLGVGLIINLTVLIMNKSTKDTA